MPDAKKDPDISTTAPGEESAPQIRKIGSQLDED